MAESYLTIERLSIKEITRIFSKIQISATSFYANTPCWEWIAGRNSCGYGSIRLRGPCRQVHRVMYAWLVSPLPNGISKTTVQIDHLCNNRRCINPVHLQAVLPKINSARGTSPIATNGAKTHCKRGHPFTPDNTYLYSGKHRQCKTCVRARQTARLNILRRDPEWLAQRREYDRDYKAAQYATDTAYREARKARERQRAALKKPAKVSLVPSGDSE